MKKLTKEEIKDIESKGAYVKNSYLYKFEDGIVIEFDKDSISKTLWYDDETEGPISKDGSNKKEAFIRYNMRSVRNPAQEFIDNEGWGFIREPFLCRQYDYEETGRCFISWQSDYCGEPDPYYLKLKVRNLTREEIEEVAEANAEVIKAYQKRLETYYKRYGDKIYQRGYWANR